MNTWRSRNQSCVIAATILFLGICTCQADDRVTTAGKEVIPLEKVVGYMGNHHQNTTFKNDQIERELIGRVYSGIVRVDDVAPLSWDKDTIQVTAQPGGWCYFNIRNNELKKIATGLEKGAEISVRAKLESFSFPRRGGNSATFVEVDEITVTKPKEDRDK
jgi:hypothetical protein